MESKAYKNWESRRLIYMSEMLLLLNYGPMPRDYVLKVFKDKNYTKADFERTEAFMGLVKETWNGITYIRKPTLTEKEDHDERGDWDEFLENERKRY